MKKLILPGFLGLSLLLIAALRLAQACEVNGHLISPPRLDTSAGDSKKQPDITFKTDGNDVVASIQVTANNSPHALSTSYRIGSDNMVTLHYTLIQNSDRFVRSIKKVKVEWRLKNFAVLPTPLLNYRVEPTTLALSAQELKGLIPQMQFLLDDPEYPAHRIEEPVDAVVIDVKMYDRYDRLGECLVNVNIGNSLLSPGKARVLISNTVKIEKVQNGKRVPASLSDLKEGARIQFSGFRTVAESYPVQVTPTHILILEYLRPDLRPLGK